MPKESKFISAMLHSNYSIVEKGDKICSNCGFPKPYKEFTKCEKYADGRRNECKECTGRKATKRYHKKKDELDFYKSMMPI